MTEDKSIERISGHGRDAKFRIVSHQHSDSKEEYFPEVNSDGKLVGSVTRTEAHTNPEHIHPGVGIFIIDPIKKDIYLPKRSTKKDKDPGCLDFSTGEHLTIKDNMTGEIETWGQAAHRGLEEEMGLPVGSYSLVRIPGHVLDTSDPSQTERRTFYIAQLTDGSQLLPDSREIDSSGGGWFKLSDLMEVVNGDTSEDNPLKGHQIRPMLLNDLRRPEVRGALEKFLENKEATS